MVWDWTHSKRGCRKEIDKGGWWVSEGVGYGEAGNPSFPLGIHLFKFARHVLSGFVSFISNHNTVNPSTEFLIHPWHHQLVAHPRQIYEPSRTR